MDIKKYKKESDYSYSLGAFPTIELLKTRPGEVTEVIVHSAFTDLSMIDSLCKKNNIPVSVNDKLISKLSDKENCFVIGIFKKYDDELRNDKPHIVLVNPGNMGNLGTIMRSSVGFGIKDMAIITPGADPFNPKTIRSSMGAAFRLNIKCFDSFDDYVLAYPEYEKFLFMLRAKEVLSDKTCSKDEKYSLVFGNEATGLPDDYDRYGRSVLIPETDEVDSLNITIAAGIAMFILNRPYFAK